MNELHARFLVQIVHAVSDLFGPVKQHVGNKMATFQRLVQAASARVLHHQTQIGLLQTDTLQLDDVGMVEKPEEFRLATNALQSVPRIVTESTCHLHCHLKSPTIHRRMTFLTYGHCSPFVSYIPIIFIVLTTSSYYDLQTLMIKFNSDKTRFATGHKRADDPLASMLEQKCTHDSSQWDYNYHNNDGNILL